LIQFGWFDWLSTFNRPLLAFSFQLKLKALDIGSIQLGIFRVEADYYTTIQKILGIYHSFLLDQAQPCINFCPFPVEVSLRLELSLSEKRHEC